MRIACTLQDRSRELGGYYTEARLRRYLGSGGLWLYDAHCVDGEESRICRRIKIESERRKRGCMWRREIELEDFKSQQPEDAINCNGGGCEKGRFGYQDQEFSFGCLGMLIIHSNRDCEWAIRHENAQL